MRHFLIKLYRQKQKMTQAELAILLGVNRATISKYETGEITPPTDQAKKIAEILKIPALELFEMKDIAEDKRQSFLSRLEEAFNKNEIQALSDLGGGYFYFYYYDKDGMSSSSGMHIDLSMDMFSLLSDAFKKLNDHGKVVAVQRVRELSEIPRYQSTFNYKLELPSNNADSKESSSPDPMTREQYHAELVRQLDDEEKAGVASSASGQPASGSAGA